jgi:hypothetical protein
MFKAMLIYRTAEQIIPFKYLRNPIYSDKEEIKRRLNSDNVSYH